MPRHCSIVEARRCALAARPRLALAGADRSWRLGLGCMRVERASRPTSCPARSLICQTLVTDWRHAVAARCWITLHDHLRRRSPLAVVGGVALAVLFAQSKWIELSFFPYAVILQVTPIVAIAPLIIIWVDDVRLSLLICAWIVAFFPILSNTTLGLNRPTTIWSTCSSSTAPTRWQTLRYLRLPAAHAVFPRRPAHLRRPGADRRGGRGVRRRHRRQRLGPRLPHPRGGLPAQRSRACSPRWC